MENSYQIQMLKLGIERTRYYLKAREASLKSKVYLNLRSPELKALSDYKWNSDLQKDEIVHQDTRRWQMDLSIRQPVILFGYPTNGYLSLNNRIYRYLQNINDEENVDYYNRYFVRFEQPLFQPNYLKNNIEEAELALEREELDYIGDIVRLIDDIADDYYNLFELSYKDVIYSNHLANLQKVSEIVNDNSQLFVEPAPRTDVPEVYVVKKGDTLWDIAEKFFGYPFIWPEIWKKNLFIDDPHWIYPGQEITLELLLEKTAQPEQPSEKPAAKPIKEPEPLNTARSIEGIQIQVELANTQEQLLGNQSDIRLETARMKQRLRVDYQDSLIVKPITTISPINVNVNQALQYGYTLRPTLRIYDIRKRQDEIYLQETIARGAFRINLEMTYGMEKQDERYQELWDDKDNSYSVSIRAYIPIWDWGRRKANIEAQRISVKRTELFKEESRNRMESEITNAVANLEEYQKRALNMKENMDVAQKLSTASITQFEKNQISIQDILKILERQKETELNFLDAYLGYRKSLVTLIANTHYDFENDISLIDKFHAM